MFADHETTTQTPSGSHAPEDEVAMDERLSWAHSIDGAIREAAGPASPFHARPTRPIVVLGAASALAALAADLRDEDVAVEREAIDAIRSFMTDGIDSPLYGRDPLGRPPRRRPPAQPHRRRARRALGTGPEHGLSFPNLLSSPSPREAGGAPQRRPLLRWRHD